MPARAYAIKTCKEEGAPNVITSTFSLFHSIVCPLIDPLFHSHIYTILVKDKEFLVDSRIMKYL